jgi:prophage regulatory protein
MREVTQITGLSRPTIYRRIAAKSFPAAIKLGENSVGWKNTAVLEWLESRSEPNYDLV